MFLYSEATPDQLVAVLVRALPGDLDEDTDVAVLLKHAMDFIVNNCDSPILKLVLFVTGRLTKIYPESVCAAGGELYLQKLADIIDEKEKELQALKDKCAKESK
ncbi:hypothetical protein O0I10_012230 [Lichtheimia ornata]|uniref:Uncharacterized protein n=1 Tax=Lichtheimia ornata TaxID=688661 RepID=A0AAD7UTD3_9FUNG|nr:uncharacterized protein O0I10_012230 [Lichtheimia ornata]KAJ8652125.1 hypothetical protein O0I10_012230 [Lichtheimia ornata]